MNEEIKQVFKIFEFTVFKKFRGKESKIGYAKLTIKYDELFVNYCGVNDRKRKDQTEKTVLTIYDMEHNYIQFEKPVFCQLNYSNYQSIKNYIDDVKNFILCYFEEKGEKIQKLEIKQTNNRNFVF